MAVGMPQKLAEIKTLSDTLAELFDYDLTHQLPWFGAEVFGNALGAYLVACITFVLYAALLYFAWHHLVKRWERLATEHPGSLWQQGLSLAHQVKPHILPLIAFYFATQPLELSAKLDHGISLLTVAAVTLQLVQLAGELARILIDFYRGGFSAVDPVIRNTNNNLTTLVRISIWVAGILFFLDNAGFNVSTFVAGLGIGGVAIALAAQAILGDTFSSFAISLDKPFEVGDFITVDTLRGTVEHIGLKTTRVRSVGGELLVFANSDLTKSRIRNFKKMQQRYVELKLHVHPLTPLAVLKEIPSLIADIISKQPNVTLDYAKLAHISGCGLIFDVAYNTKSPAFNDYADSRQAIYFAIMEAFAAKGVTMRFDSNMPVVFMPT
jgi:small-conductance mechanosensitive channel